MRQLLRAGIVREFFFPDGKEGLRNYVKGLRGDWSIISSELAQGPDGLDGYKVTIVQQYNGSPLYREEPSSGHWIKVKGYDDGGLGEYCVCPKCNQAVWVSNSRKDEHHYCGRCGAKLEF